MRSLVMRVTRFTLQRAGSAGDLFRRAGNLGSTSGKLPDANSLDRRCGGKRRLGVQLAAFNVEVLFEVGGGDGGGNAVRRHLDFCHPENAIQRHLAEISVPPVTVEMATGEPETAAAIGPLARPRDSLRFTLFNCRACAGIALPRAIGAAHGCPVPPSL